MDFKQIKALMKDFDESGLSKLSLKHGEFAIDLEKATGLNYASPVTHVAPQYTAPVVSAPISESSAPVATAEVVGEKILSPMVGTYYASPSPDSAPFIKVGDVIKKGQPVAILEAMKIMNEIEAEFPCKIVKILVENGQPVEYDMPLFIVEKI